MQMKGEQQIAAGRREVWAALNDPVVLARCIPGCQSLERDGENRFLAVAEVKIGPIGARFKGSVQLSDLDPPNGYKITGSGQGGIAGSAKGGATVRLADAPGGGTLVIYEVDAEVGGRMAQLGGPIIDATARNLAGKFFATFGQVVGGTAPALAAAEAPAGQARETSSHAASPAGPVHPAPVAAVPAPPWGWVAALLLTLLAGFVLGRQNDGLAALVVAMMLVGTAAAAYEAGRRGGRA